MADLVAVFVVVEGRGLAEGGLALVFAAAPEQTDEDGGCDEGDGYADCAADYEAEVGG